MSHSLPTSWLVVLTITSTCHPLLPCSHQRIHQTVHRTLTITILQRKSLTFSGITAKFSARHLPPSPLKFTRFFPLIL
ncbi:hypothetical protein BJ165DRAFT_1518896 [Panaeolus papilionaceus]|nr:hypothetical protein BJ165DRAFT_1518896 [Panaeolus papilionaceus]